MSEQICLIDKPLPIRVAIDGIDVAGKTTFADELAFHVSKQSTRKVVRTSVDSLLNSKESRYGKGELSPFGYYEDSFNYSAFKASLLSKSDSVLLVDGIFLLRPKIIDLLDFKVFLDVSFETSIARTIKRGDADRHRYETRYVPGQKIYLAQCHPSVHADIVIDNNDFSNPEIAMIHLNN